MLASALFPQPSKPNTGTVTTAPANKSEVHLSEAVFCWAMFRTTGIPKVNFYNMELNDDSLKNFKGNKRAIGKLSAVFIGFERLIKMKI